jgi:hypothetical protein
MNEQAATAATGRRRTNLHLGYTNQATYEAQLRASLPHLRASDPARAAYLERLFPWWADSSSEEGA